MTPDRATRPWITAAISLAALASSASAQLTPMEQLGQQLFFDTNLSTPPGQSCAACHGPEVGFTGPAADVNAHGAVYPGAVFRRFGARKPPSAAYDGASPVLHYDSGAEAWIGGVFWDGRATGWTLGDPLAEQALGPFLNPLEQNNPNPRLVVLKVARSSYADLFRQVWGPDALGPLANVSQAYERIGRSIAAYERSIEVNPFSSKYDRYLAGLVALTAEEAAGLALFEGQARCAACHPCDLGPGGEPPLLTDFTYDNLGLPRNPENPFYSMPPSVNPDGAAWVDPGLGGFLASAGFSSEVAAAELGKHKVPTLRNVDQRPTAGFVKAYGHNGVFKSLEDIVHFYNTRDVAGAGWAPPEVSVNVNTDELGDLGLTPAQEAALVAFLRTLTDGYAP